MSAMPRITPASRALALLLLPALAAPAPADLAARWLGQDGHDEVGGEPGPAKNDFQDIHIALRGLSPRRSIAGVVIKAGGGGEWDSKATNRFTVLVARPDGSPRADLYIEPYRREVGRPFEVHVKYDDGREAVAYFAGGRADPNLRARVAGVEAEWVGQDGQDRTGAGPGVGPDGFEDIHLTLARLAPKAEVKSVEVAGPGGSTWQSGLNPKGHHSAEFDRKADDPGRGDLYFSPGRDLDGQALKVTVTYGDDRADVASIVAGRCHPAKAMPTPAASTLTSGSAMARWLGQDGSEAAPSTGDVHVTLEGLPPGRIIAAAALSDGVVGTWTFRSDDKVRLDAGPDPGRLGLKASGLGKVDLAFSPIRDESGATMTLRLLDGSGGEEVIRFPGGKANPGLRAPALPPGAVTARPGDDLHGLVGRYGTVTLAAGAHELSRPLVLDRPTRLVGEPGASLRFAQGADQPPWTAAIKIHAGGTTLEGFAVRFAGPVRWDRAVEYGPALIGTTDDRDRAAGDPKFAVGLVRLDLQSPPASSAWEEAPHAFRAASAASGRVERCVLKSGGVVFAGGPWSIVDNDCRGTVPGTFCRGLFAGNYVHDLVVARNHARDDGPSGKTWRFLVLAQRGAFDVVRDNVVEGGFGPREDDPRPHDNAPELILTEAYRLHFEGRPASISADGRVLAIPPPQGGPAGTGDAVAILAGPQAGQWRTIAQPLGPDAYLLDEPIDRATEAVSIATGFVRETFEANTVDCRGSGIAMDLVLAGNQFGARVVGNRLVGGRQPFALTAFPTESPSHWGWSHAPFLGGVFAANLIEDPETAGVVGVDHSPHIKSNKGRVYMSLALQDNTFRRTRPPRDRKEDGPANKGAGNPGRLAIGIPGGIDPGELVITEQGTKLEGGPDDDAWVHAATVNGKVIREAALKAGREGRGRSPMIERSAPQ